MSLRYGIIITILIDVLKNIAVKFYLEAFVYSHHKNKGALKAHEKSDN